MESFGGTEKLYTKRDLAITAFGVALVCIFTSTLGFCVTASSRNHTVQALEGQVEDSQRVIDTLSGVKDYLKEVEQPRQTPGNTVR